MRFSMPLHGGGMGVVLKAADRSLDRVVAIKVLSPHLASSGAARTRFEREAKAAAAVLHPNVIAIHGVSTDSVLPFLVMPYVRGGTLQKRIDTEGPMPLADILRLGTQIAAGLAAAHKQGLIHRDIKPANVLLEDGVERVAITDFGLARAVDDASITKTGVIAGTPQYMSPEQARGEAIDHRTDLFSLGSVLYTLCTGRPPFRADSTYGILRRITDDTPTPIREINPQIPDWLCSIIDRLHAKSSNNRYRTADEVAELLRSCLAHLQTPNTPLPSELQPIQRSRLSIATCALLFALAVVLGVISIASRHGGDEPSSQSGDVGAPTVGKAVDEQTHADDWIISESETDWIDQQSPSTLEIERAATELAEQTESFYPGPAR